MEILTKAYDTFQMAFIGCIGAMISLWMHPEAKDRRGALMFVFTGVCIAQFTTGLVADYFAITAKHAGAVGFLLGAFGGSLFSAIQRAINQADFLSVIKRLMGVQ